MTEFQARAELEQMVQHEIAPTLSSPEIDQLIALCRRSDIDGNLPYTPRENETEYGVGEMAVPSPRNAHVYVVTVAGETAAAPPVWPTETDATVVDGGVTWQEAGAAPWTPTFDLNAAAAEGWRRKAGKVVPNYSFSVDNQRSDQGQVYEHCLAQAARYAALQSTNVRLR